MPIKSFANQTTADVAARRNTKHARRVPQRIWKAAYRKLDVLESATSLQEIGAAPGMNLEALKHTRPGFYSVWINDQYRVFFRFENGEACDVEIEGYDHTGRR